MQRHKKLKKVAVIVAIIAVPIMLLVVDWFIYPLRTTHPNFSDVNRVFNKMTFPTDWKVIRTSENKGTAGRACPIESESLCYHKSITFSIPTATTLDQVKSILTQTGCPTVSSRDNKSSGDTKEKYILECSNDALTMGSDYNRNTNEVYISVSTK